VADNETFSKTLRLGLQFGALPDPILSRANELKITFQANASDYGNVFLTTFQSGKVIIPLTR